MRNFLVNLIQLVAGFAVMLGLAFLFAESLIRNS